MTIWTWNGLGVEVGVLVEIDGDKAIRSPCIEGCYNDCNDHKDILRGIDTQ